MSYPFPPGETAHCFAPVPIRRRLLNRHPTPEELAAAGPDLLGELQRFLATEDLQTQPQTTWDVELVGPFPFWPPGLRYVPWWVRELPWWLRKWVRDGFGRRSQPWGVFLHVYGLRQVAKGGGARCAY